MSTKVAGKELKPRHVTKFNIPCAFNGEVSEVAVFIGEPESKHSPIHFQSKFIQDTRGGVIPQSVFESLEKLQKLAIENGVPFEELCRYALGSMTNEAESENADAKIEAPSDTQAAPVEAESENADEDTTQAAPVETESETGDNKIEAPSDAQATPVEAESENADAKIEAPSDTQAAPVEAESENADEDTTQATPVEADSENADAKIEAPSDAQAAPVEAESETVNK